MRKNASNQPFDTPSATLLAATGAALGYFCLAAATIHLTSDGRNIATVWPANAVLLALVLARPLNGWWTILFAGFIGNIAANYITRGTIEGPLLYGIANIVEVLVAGIGLHASVDQGGVLRKPGMVFRFVLWAGIFAPFTSALLGAATASAVFDQSFRESFLTWFFSDALGLIIFAPFLFALFRGDYQRCFLEKSPAERFESVGTILLTALVATIVFRSSHLPILFLVAMPVTLTTFRSGWLGTKIAIMVVAVVGAICTLNGIGPITLSSSDPRFQALFFQFFLASLLIAELPVAAALSAQKSLTGKLADQERAMRMLASQSPDLLISFDEKGFCQYALGAAQSLFGRNEESFVGQRIDDLVLDPGSLLKAQEQALKEIDGLFAVEFVPLHREDLWLEANFRARTDDDGNVLGILASIHDITARKQQEKALLHSASTDALTGLLNRKGFLQRLDGAIMQGHQTDICLALIDVDRFKMINDNAGHLAGDLVLQEIGHRLSAHTRGSDAVGRLGGDEFIVLLPHCSWDKAKEICARLVTAMRDAPVNLLSGSSIHISISCGVTRYSEGWTASDFLECADRALYEAKSAGRNQMVAF